MIKMDELKKLIKYVLFTAYLEGEKPTSLLVIAKTESGKTESIDNFKDNEGIVYINDATPYGLVKELYKFKDIGKKVNHIMIPDLLNPLSKGRASVDSFIHFVNSITEEGLTKIHTAGVQFDIPMIQAGVITAITREKFASRKKFWQETGFLNRFLPFSYKYPIKTAQEIFENIFNETYLNNDKENIKFPDKKVLVKSTEEFNKMLYPYTARLANQENTHGFRFQKNYQRLLKAIALSKNRSEVIKEDVEELQRIAEYMNLEFNEIE